MTSIEERIVSLGFNNQSFEKHAAQSLSTLDKLDATLDAIGGSKGIGLLTDTLETVASKFSVLGTIGDQVLRRIADGIMDVANKGLQLGKSLSIDQITAGWSKYGEKTSAVQTIMAATAKDWDDTGAQMEYVNEQLDKLNWFTDETSYSFLDMVNNIGKFTSNGIALEDSVTSMQGISTWAAISGANIQEAGRAMYNLSQALATGSVKLMDWKSIENANMATLEFKETALETAVNIGTLTKSVDANGKAIYKTAQGHEFAAEQFNTYLSDAWFSKEVLQATLKQYGDFANVLNDVGNATGMTATEILQAIDAYKETGKVSEELAPYIQQLASDEYDLGRRAFKAAQEAKTFAEALAATKDAVSTGWMNTFEKIFGNYQEAKKLWTGLANGLWEVFAAGGELRNEALDVWRKMGGYEKLWDSMGSIGNNLIEILGQVRNGFLDIFGPDVNFGNNDKHVVQLSKILNDLTRSISKAADQFDTFVSSITQFNVIPKIIQGLRNSFQGLATPLKVFHNVFKETFDPIFNAYKGRENKLGWPRVLALHLNHLSNMFLGASQSFKNFMKSAETVEKFKNIAGGIVSVLNTIRIVAISVFENLTPIITFVRSIGVILLDDLSKIGLFITGVSEGVNTAVEKFDLFGKVSQGIQDILVGLYTPISLLKHAFAETFGSETPISERVATILQTIGDKFSAISSSFKEFMQMPWVIQELSDVARGIAALFDIGRMAISALKEPLQVVWDRFIHFGKWAIHDLSRVSKLIVSVKDHLKEIGAFERIGHVLAVGFQALGKILDVVGYAFRTIVYFISNNFTKLDGIGGSLLDIIEKVFNVIIDLCDEILDTSAFEGFSSVLEVIFDVLTKIVDTVLKHNPFELLATGVKKAFDFISRTLGTIKGKFQEAFSTDNNFGGNILSVLGGIVAALIGFKKLKTGSSIKKFVDTLNDILKNGFGSDSILGKLGETVGGILDGLKNAFNSFANNMNAKALKEVAIAIGILTASLLVLSLLDRDKLAESLFIIAGGLGAMMGAMAIINKIKIGKGKTTELIKVAAAVFLFALAIGAVSVALVVLGAAAKIFASIEPNKLVTALLGMAVALGAVVLSLAILNKYASSGKMLAAGASIMMIAVAILVLSAALKILSTISSKKMTTAVLGMAVALGAIVLALSLLSKYATSGKMLAAGASILMVAAALLALTVALAVLALIPGDALGKSMLFLAGGLIIMVAALAVLGAVGPMVLAAGAALLMLGVAMVLMSASMLVLSFALERLAPLKNDIIKIAGGLAVLGLALIPLGIGGIVAGLGLIGFAALIPLAFALSMIGGLKLSSIAGGLALLGLSFIPLGIGGAALALGAPGLILGSIGLWALGLALPILAVGIKAFGGIEAKTLLGVAGAIALIGLAGVPLLLGAAGLLLGAPALVALGHALPALAEGFSSFGQVNWESIGKAAVILAEAITALFALQFATILDGVPVLQELAFALPSIAMGFSSFEGLDWEAIGKAGVVLAEAIGALFALEFATILDGVPVLMELAAAIPMLSSGFGSFENVTWDAVVKASNSLHDAVSALFKLEFATIRDGTPALKNLSVILPDLAFGFASFNDVNAASLLQVSGALGAMISSLFQLQFSTILDGTPALKGLAEALPTLAAGFRAFEGMDPMWIEQVATSLRNGLDALLGNVIGNLFKGGTDFSTLATNLLILSQAVSTIPEDSETRLTGIANGLAAISTSVTTASAEITTTIDTMLTTITTTMDAIELDITTTTDTVTEKITMAISKIDTAVNDSANKNRLKISGTMTSIRLSISNAMNSITTSVSIGMSNVETSISNAMSSIEGIVSAAAANMATYGWNIGINLANGIWEAVPYVEQAGYDLANAASIANSVSFSNYGFGYSSGASVTLGFAEGIFDGMSAVESAMAGAQRASENAWNGNDGWRVNSPSKVMIESAGYVIQGFVNGIKSNSYKSEEAMMDAVNPLLAIIESLNDEGMEISPLITPVVDMSDVETMASQTAALFGDSGTYTLNAARRISGDEMANGGNFGSYNSVGDTINANINVYAQPGQDMNELARIIEQRLVRLNKQQRLGALI